MQYKRILLKLSGEALMGERQYGIDPQRLKEYARDLKEVVDLGDIGFWPPGNAICLFFGPTPISSEGEIRPASSVNIVGKLIGNLEELKLIKSASKISVVKSD